MDELRKQGLAQALILSGLAMKIDPPKDNRHRAQKHWSTVLARCLVSTAAFAYNHQVGFDTARQMMWIRMANKAKAAEAARRAKS